MRFSYKARDAKGNMVEGILEASDKFFVAKELRARNQFPVSVEPYEKKRKIINASFLDQFFSGITLHEKIVFVNNLSGMLTAGLALYRALEVESRQIKNDALKTVVNGLMMSVNQGEALSEGMSKYPAVFSPLFTAIIKAGEESGNLPWALKEVGTNLEKSYELSRKIKGALTYPAIIICAIFAVGILMLMFVVPTLTKIFADLNAKLPMSTQFIISVSNGVSNHPIIFLGIIVLMVFGIYSFVYSKRLKRFNDTWILKVPVIGQIVIEVNTARTARTLSSLLKSGVDIAKAISITRDVVQNENYKEVLVNAEKAVQKGESLASVFKTETKLYPIMISEMMAVGEETGALSDMLANAATFYEDEVDAKTKSLSTIIEPVVMIMVGIAVGFFAISMISPMYSLLGNINQ